MAEGQDVTQACYNLVHSLDKLLARLNNPQYQLYLTGQGNFRYDIYPEYKANRKDQVKPTHLQAVKEFAIKEYKAVISEGCEADDLCGIDQYQSNLLGEETLLVHTDKDLDMIPGNHFNPELWREGICIREERRYIVSPNDAIRHFYWQMLVGDPTDNIKGARGIGPKKAAPILGDLTDEMELYQAIEPYYSSEEEILLNGQCLWIWREPEGIWRLPSSKDNRD